MSEEKLEIQYRMFSGPDGLAEDERHLLDEAMSAARGAYAIYSGFHVGCAVALSDGRIFSGNNQENPAFPSGMCAERTVLNYVGAQGCSGLVRKLAIRAYSIRKVVSSPVTPCGACRQVIAETERQAEVPMVVLMQGEHGAILRLEGVRQTLLPFVFDIDF